MINRKTGVWFAAANRVRFPFPAHVSLVGGHHTGQFRRNVTIRTCTTSPFPRVSPVHAERDSLGTCSTSPLHRARPFRLNVTLYIHLRRNVTLGTCTTSPFPRASPVEAERDSTHLYYIPLS
ncbi:hypothetical protein DPMN_049232 [Dreissena polymorpha]|uniref:Uncharacterized protein n=1 Tax=Dreissena polymorpha TaxID=45954 RepID=A0A9D4HL39_DREPO|nr:hypothetical protein DPMN_049232 [Dreissena polymorpha]